uniref:PilW family protein n=1 Tax=Hylemonella sp. TaxID=2066020 RepID=UPI0035ADE5BF
MKILVTSSSGQRAQSGLTLVELLVAMALGTAVLVALGSVYVAAKQAYRYQESVGRMTEDGGYALDTIAKHLRMSGFAGCMGVAKESVSGPPATTTYYPTSALGVAAPGGISGPNPLQTVLTTSADAAQQPLTPTTFLRGFDAAPSVLFASGSAPSVPSGSVADVLFFSGGSANAMSPAAVMASASAEVSLGTTDPYGWSGKGVMDFIISDCSNSALFRGQVTASGGNFNLTHSAADGNMAATFPSSVLYDQKALVMPLEWRLYYLNTRSGATFPSLYVISYDGKTRSNPIELVANVEALKINYGENTQNDAGGLATMQADVWRTSAAAVTDWSRVVAVRIGIIMAASDTSSSKDFPVSVPTLLGASYTPPSSAPAGTVRKEFSTTVTLRNRVPPR